MRFLLALGLVAVFAWMLLGLRNEPAAPAPARAFTSSQQCRECHEQTYVEWESSWHAMSWIDPEVRKLSSDFANQDCIDCHAPRPVLETGIANRVLPRASRRAEGVDCLTCHLHPDGSIAGTRDVASAACKPVATRDLVSPQFCAPCHDQHGTVKQWQASRFAVPGPDYRSCSDCHMPRLQGDRRDHRMHGGHDLAMLQAAVTLRATRAPGAVPGTVLVELENSGAGHNFPTDERSRAADLFWREQGQTTWRHLARLRNPYRHEVGLPNTELASGDTLRVSIDQAPAGPIEVALFYKLSPYWNDPAAPDPEREAVRVALVSVAP